MNDDDDENKNVSLITNNKRKFTDKDNNKKVFKTQDNTNLNQILVPAIPQQNSIISSYYHIHIFNEPDLLLVLYPQNQIKQLPMRYLFTEIQKQFSKLNISFYIFMNSNLIC